MTEIERLQAWKVDQNDPDNWFEIPEFGVKPVDVAFRGFMFPIVRATSKHYELAELCREHVRAIRSLVRLDFKTIEEWRTYAGEALDASDSLIKGGKSSVKIVWKHVVAVFYNLARMELHLLSMRMADDDLGESIKSLSRVTEITSVWTRYRLNRGARSAESKLIEFLERYKQIQNNSKEAGKLSGKARAATARAKPAEVIAARNQLLTQGKASRDIASILSQRFNVSPDYIRKILRKNIQN